MDITNFLQKIIILVIIYIVWICISCNMEGKRVSFECLKQNVKIIFSIIVNITKKLKIINIESFDTNDDEDPVVRKYIEIDQGYEVYDILKKQYKNALRSFPGLGWNMNEGKILTTSGPTDADEVGDENWHKKTWRLKPDKTFFTPSKESMPNEDDYFENYMLDFFKCVINEINVLQKQVEHLQNVNRSGEDMKHEEPFVNYEIKPAQNNTSTSINHSNL